MRLWRRAGRCWYGVSRHNRSSTVTEPETSAPKTVSWGARVGLFLAAGLLGTLASIVLLYFLFYATGPEGPDSGMGNALGAVMLSPVGGVLYGLGALLWQARSDRGGSKLGIVAAVLLVLVLIVVFVFTGFGAI